MTKEWFVQKREFFNFNMQFCEKSFQGKKANQIFEKTILKLLEKKLPLLSSLVKSHMELERYSELEQKKGYICIWLLANEFCSVLFRLLLF